MKILVGYDRSSVSEYALKLALKHANAFDAEVQIMTALDQDPELRREDIEKAESELEKVKPPFKADGIACKTYTIVNQLSAGENLVQFAKDNNIDEIIIGVMRRSKVGKLLFGSTAQYIILNAPCPIVTLM